MVEGRRLRDARRIDALAETGRDDPVDDRGGRDRGQKDGENREAEPHPDALVAVDVDHYQRLRSKRKSAIQPMATSAPNVSVKRSVAGSGASCCSVSICISGVKVRPP